MTNTYENPEFGIKDNFVFPNEKIMSTEVFISYSDNKTQKFFRRNNNVFYNAKIDGKKDFAASCNEEDLENKDDGNEPSTGILCKMTGFFSQILGMCRCKK